MSKKKPAKFDASTFRTSFGLFLALLGIFLLLAPLTRLGYVVWPVFYLFGLSGYAIAGLLAIEAGLHAFFAKKWKRYSARVHIGLTLLALALWAICGAAGAYLNPDILQVRYVDVLNDAFASSRHSLFSNSIFLGGQFGRLLFGHIAASVGTYLGFIVAGSLLFFALITLFFPLIALAFEAGRTKRTIARARRQKMREEQQKRDSLDFVIEGEEGPTPVPDFETNPLPPAPGLSFAKENPASETEEPPSLQSSFTFAPAGGSTLPSRRSLRTKTASAPVMEEQAAPTSAFPSTLPREMPNPDRSLYASNPVRSSGLREALFIPSDVQQREDEKQREEVAKEQNRETLHEIMPSFLGQPIVSAPSAPAPEPEPAPVMETAPLPVTPAPTVSPAPIIEDAAREITMDESSEEEEYVPPSNDPIPLMPANDGIIIGGVSEESEEEETEIPSVVPLASAPASAARSAPAPAPEPEPEPVDDDIEGPLPPYTFPDASLLFDVANDVSIEDQKAECAQTAANIDKIFTEFRVGAHVVDVLVGPSITRYSVESDAGVSVQTISRVIPDLEVKLGGVSIRFSERILGSPYSGLEIANSQRRIVSFKELIEMMPPRKEGPDLNIPFGLDIAGKLQCADLAKFPHMLVAGTSGSGKSIFAHGLLMSLIMRNRPENLKLVLIDPKRGVEMARYKDLPHLLCPIVKEPIPAKNALKKLVDLMNERYKKLEESGTTDIKEYNNDYALPEGKKRMPYIVCFVDEFADIVGECKEIMDYVNVLAAKARSCGIHVIVATQRPDVKVITGTLKANLLCRVALTVATAVDSVTILGQGGAEALYGYGDMLIDCQQLSKREKVRAQGCLTSFKEGKKVCDFIRAQMPPSYDPDFLDLEDHDDEGPEIRDGGYDPIPAGPVGPTPQEMRNASNEEKYLYIRSIIMTRETCSISMIQRDFEVGFPRAGKILSRLQKEGIVAPASDSPNSSKGCRVLIHSEDEIPSLPDEGESA